MGDMGVTNNRLFLWKKWFLNNLDHLMSIISQQQSGSKAHALVKKGSTSKVKLLNSNCKLRNESEEWRNDKTKVEIPKEQWIQIRYFSTMTV